MIAGDTGSTTTGADSAAGASNHARAETPRSRRAMLAAAAAMLGAAGGRRAGAQPVGSSADIDPNAILHKLVGRVSFGATQTELARAQELGYWGYIEEQLALTEADDDPALATRLSAYTTLTMTGEQLYAFGNTALQRIELVEATILRAVMSRRQLYERLVEFWSDHFSIDFNTDQSPYLKTLDDRLVIRQYALGTVPQLIFASAQSPSMLNYLDNDVNTLNGPNENYGRELLELHTMGVNSGYTQADVQNVAKALTGWTRWNSTATPSSVRGTFRYRDSQHDKTQKVVLGHVLAANRGMEDGIDVLNILAYEPRTAAFISKKLCRRFIGESCPQAHIDAVTATYLATGGDIKSMIRTMLNPRVLWDAPARYKRPFHLFASALRVLPATINSLSNYRTRLTGCGHYPFAWLTPDGYPDTIDYWGGLILPRWNYGATIVPGSASNVLIDVAAFFSGLTTAAQIANKIDQAMFCGTMLPADKTAVETYLGAGNPSTSRRNEAIGLAIGAPSFQWY